MLRPLFIKQLLPINHEGFKDISIPDHADSNVSFKTNNEKKRRHYFLFKAQSGSCTVGFYFFGVAHTFNNAVQKFGKNPDMSKNTAQVAGAEASVNVKFELEPLF